jgi:hypothetical protein
MEQLNDLNPPLFLSESAFLQHKSMFLSAAKAKFPSGYQIFKKSIQIKYDAESGNYILEFSRNEVFIFLMHFTTLSFPEQPAEVTTQFIERIIEFIYSEE